MPDHTSSASKAPSPTQVIVIGMAVIVGILVVAALVLFLNLPDANAFNMRVERIFIENDALKQGGEIRLLEILAQSGTAFSDTLASYRFIIFVLLVFATALLIAALVSIVFLVTLARRMAEIEKSGIQVSSLVVSRGERIVQINDMEFKLTEAALETLSVLAEARLDDDILSGLEIEAMISGRPEVECDEASGATRIKRLRDHLGNQMMSELLIKNIARKGYVLAVEPGAIKMI
ncbi:winged helix-turn-helix domain-containing protein [Litoreibacter arenae]|uniref:Response regulator n=1 Tax=Litoreibacter arenae DSM 19593 TaxID=1123360 RepID=S9RUZ8_9RHOB|nr:response regulator transcription factor [Litoreibacter arenae]EPX77779.1 Response regulator [Litoreibacter arenae DSM 19593]